MSIISATPPNEISELPLAVAYIDGQNLFHEAQRAFGYDYPNYDIQALAVAVCKTNGWQLKQARFYTGIPGPGDDPTWNSFWQRKLRTMSQRGVHTFSRALRYRTESLDLPDGTNHTYRYAQEKGIDVRIAIDALRGAFKAEYQVAIIFSLDQDLSEVAADIRSLGLEQGRTIVVASAYPFDPAYGTPKPIANTLPIQITRAVYDTCIDRRDYRPAHRSR